MKRLIRYTIGQVSKLGWTILSEAVRHIQKVYPEFDVVVCHNNLDYDQLAYLDKLDVPLFRQDGLPKPFNFKNTNDGKVRDFFWKLVPPRLNMFGQELWVDNDIVIRDRVNSIDTWMYANTALLGSGFNRDYGCFEEEIKFGPAYCAGIFGLPPNFDFQSEINRWCNGREINGFDEQGLVVGIASSVNNFVCVPQNEMPLLSEHWAVRGIRNLHNGMHFARANRFDNHRSWRYYKFSTTP